MLQRLFVLVVLIAFSALTTVALWRHGYWGIIEPHFQSAGGAQVFTDLVIALSLVVIWMWRDAKAAGRNPWPWIVLTLVVGSIGPLLYLCVRGTTAESLLGKKTPNAVSTAR
jgi:Terpene cyclase DEP1